jgi:hypothetical protein
MIDARHVSASMQSAPLLFSRSKRIVSNREGLTDVTPLSTAKHLLFSGAGIDAVCCHNSFPVSPITINRGHTDTILSCCHHARLSLP